MSACARILIVDDEADFARAVATRLERAGYEARLAHSLAEARKDLAEAAGWAPDLVLLDMRLPDGTGLQLLDELGAGAPAVIAVTAFGDIDNAVEAMKRGAADYLRKPVDLDELVHAAARTLEAAHMHARLTYAHERDSHALEPAELLGDSPSISTVRRELDVIAALGGEDGAAPPCVLITGETGTGKDVAARILHARGPRAEAPFVRIDCATLAGDAGERELFGEAGGPPGLIEAAESGTVFLDEVAELSPALQARLVPVIERGRLRRAGGDREVAVAARFIAASGRDLAALVKAGAFRADLFYRLNVLGLRLPPLRECAGDAARLARHFARAVARRYGRPPPELSESAAAMLDHYAWPGNVRELAHLIERAVLLSRDGRIGARDLPMPGPDVAGVDGANPYAALDGMTVEGAERWLITRALERTGGNVSAAARALGLTRMAMRYRMDKHGL